MSPKKSLNDPNIRQNVSIKSETKNKCDSESIPDECDFIYDSFVEVHPEYTKLSHKENMKSNSKSVCPEENEKFENSALQEVENMKDPNIMQNISEKSGTNNKCHSGSIPDECDFIYDSFVEIHPEDTKCSYKENKKTNHKSNFPLENEDIDKPANSAITENVQILNAAIDTLQLDFANIVRDMTCLEMDAGKITEIPTLGLQCEKVDANEKKFKETSVQTRRTINRESSTSMGSVKRSDKLCQCNSFELFLKEKLETISPKQYKTLKLAQSLQKPVIQPVTDVTEVAKEMIQSIKNSLNWSEEIQNLTCNVKDYESLRIFPTTLSDASDTKHQKRLKEIIERYCETRALSPMTNFTKSLEIKKNVEQLHTSNLKYETKLLADLKNLIGILDIEPKEFDSEKIPEEDTRIKSDELSKQSNQGSDEENESSQSFNREVQVSRTVNYATKSENDAIDTSRNEFLLKTSSSDKILALKEALGVEFFKEFTGIKSGELSMRRDQGSEVENKASQPFNKEARESRIVNYATKSENDGTDTSKNQSLLKAFSTDKILALKEAFGVEFLKEFTGIKSGELSMRRDQGSEEENKASQPFNKEAQESRIVNYATKSENDNTDTSKNQSLLKASSSDKTLALKEAFGIEFLRNHKEHSPNIKTKERNAFVTVCHDEMNENSDSDTTDDKVLILGQIGIEKEKHTVTDETMDPPIFKSHLKYENNTMPNFKSYWKIVFEEYF